MFAGVDYALLEIESWVRGLPAGSVAVETLRNPPDNEYGAAAVVKLTPRFAESCTLEIHLVDDAPLAIGLALDGFARLGTRFKIDFATPRKNGGDYAALFLEPRAIGRERFIQMCEAVARGDIRLTLGLLAGRLTATRGGLLLPGETAPMEGIGGPLWLYRVLRPAGVAELRPVNYSPWR